MIAAPTLLHCTVGQACHQVVHFLFGADIVGFVQKVLLLLFGQMGIAVHSGSVGRKGKAEAYRNLIKIHSHTSLCCCIQHILNKNAISRCGIVDEDVSDCAYQFAVLYNR